MIIISRKRFEEEIERKTMELRREEEVWRRMDELNKHMYEIQEELHSLRDKVYSNVRVETAADCCVVPTNSEVRA